MKYDLRRKMSYFCIAINNKKTSLDLYNAVQKYIHMIELYHLNLRSNIAGFDESETDENGSPEISSPPSIQKRRSITGSIHEKKDYTIRELIELTLSNDRK